MDQTVTYNVPLKQKVFDDIKRSVSQDTLLEYPGFNRCFDTHIDASDYPLGAVIIQNGKNNLFHQPKTDRTTNIVYSNGKVIAEYSQNLKVISHDFIGSKVKNLY